MRALPTILASVAFSLIAAQTLAASTKLTVVNVDPGVVDCVFSAKCNVTPTDTMGNFPDNRGYIGPVRLQSRTYVGAPHSKAAGKTVYIYRLNFAGAVKGKTEMSCAEDMDIDFGPVEKLPYGAKGAVGDIFVITAGPKNSVGVKSATQSKTKVSIEFASPVCPSTGAAIGGMTYFFGMASTKAPKAGTVKVSLGMGGSGTADVPARIPTQ